MKEYKMNMGWNGIIPKRRYAFFSSILAPEGMVLTVIQGDDIEKAEKWGGFVSWYGPERPAEKRNVAKKA